jgi:hypothetical protein
MTATAPASVHAHETPSVLDWGARTVKVVPGHSPGRGRGLFAVAGEVIDRACTVYIGEHQTKPLDAMQPLGDFYFEHPRSKEAGLMVLGLASLCNHANPANTNVRFEEDALCGWIAVLYALDAIAPGAEVTYRYRCPLWFEPSR